MKYLKTYYHKARWVKQWLQGYANHIFNVTKALVWARKNNISIPFKETLEMFKWNSWSRYKSIHHYYYIKNRKFYMKKDLRNI